MADRGSEFLGNPSEQLVNAFQVEITNVPARRPDLKALVEGQFRTTNETGIHFEPGAVTRARKRGEKDPRLDAVHTVESFTKLIIEIVLWANNGRPLSREGPVGMPMPEDREVCALDLWEWGLENRFGLLKRVDSERARIDLLPISKARATEDGIKVKETGLNYTSPERDVQAMLLRNTGRSTKKLSVSWERRDVSQVFLRLDNGKRIVPLVLTAPHARFAGKTLEEVKEHQYVRRLRKAKGQSKRLQARAEFNARAEAIREDATKKTKAVIGPYGKLQVSDSREARNAEKLLERTNEASRWQSAEHVPASTASDDDEIPFPRLVK
jgi:hypothetical protein